MPHRKKLQTSLKETATIEGSVKQPKARLSPWVLQKVFKILRFAEFFKNFCLLRHFSEKLSNISKSFIS